MSFGATIIYQRNMITQAARTVKISRVSERQYGFRLPFCQMADRKGNSIKVRGMELLVDQEHYVRVDQADRSIIIGSEHSGAYFFMVEAYRDGLVHGSERFVHCDLADHPDNSTLSGSFVAKVDDAALMLDRAKVHSANYVTALAGLFPGMSFEFLHANERPNGPNDYQGAKFNLISSIYDEAQALSPRDIASIDLDMFASCHWPWQRQELIGHLSRLTAENKLVMIFLSPGWIDRAESSGLASQLLDTYIK